MLDCSKDISSWRRYASILFPSVDAPPGRCSRRRAFRRPVLPFHTKAVRAHVNGRELHAIDKLKRGLDKARHERRGSRGVGL